MNEKYEKLEALLADEEKAEKVFVEDVQQTLQNLADLGIDLSEKELADLAAGVIAGTEASGEEGELSESDLENVAGGGSIMFLIGHHHAVGGKKNKFLYRVSRSYKAGWNNGCTMVGGCCCG